jgi:hypothetical protein
VYGALSTKFVVLVGLKVWLVVLASTVNDFHSVVPLLQSFTTYPVASVTAVHVALIVMRSPAGAVAVTTPWVRAFGLTVNDLVTVDAASYVGSPAWSAETVQVPTARIVMADPTTVHTGVVDDAKDTVNPDVAVATAVIGEAPNAWVLIVANEMLCVLATIAKDVVT